MRDDVIAHFVRGVPLDDVMRHVARVSAHDRYQASRGIEAAAAEVADAARAVGLDDVEIRRFPADGAARWWSFQAPRAWTPLVARLDVRVGDRSVLALDHARAPFALATYSAAAPAGGVTARLVHVADRGPVPDVAGAIAVAGRTAFARAGLLGELIAAGAAGFVTDAPCRTEENGAEHRGRVELELGSPLFGFSVTSSEMEALVRCAAEGAWAHAVVEVDAGATMPVVSGVLPGARSDDEVWLTAHLCHPRPGANDNASGVAALLGVAAAHAASRRASAAWGAARTVRFVWGPEFLGVAALLHGRLGAARAPLAARAPSAAINLDMVGEDQSRCASPFVVERNPDCQPALLGPLAEHVVDRVFAATRAHAGRWHAVPFMGFSDHALFADASVASPAVQFCHPSDRFNHSAGDTLANVSPVEMLRSTAAAAALAHVAANDDALPRDVTERIVRDWCEREATATRVTAERYRGAEDGAWSTRLVDYVERRNAALRALSDGAPAPGPAAVARTAPAAPSAPAAPNAPGASEPDGPVVTRRWEGPFNGRAMQAALSPAGRAAVADAIRADKRNLAVLLNFALRADGTRTRRGVIAETSFALGRPIDGAVCALLFDALLESGWVAQAPAAAASER